MAAKYQSDRKFLSFAPATQEKVDEFITTANFQEGMGRQPFFRDSDLSIIESLRPISKLPPIEISTSELL